MANEIPLPDTIEGWKAKCEQLEKEVARLTASEAFLRRELEHEKCEHSFMISQYNMAQAKVSAYELCIKTFGARGDV